MGAPIGSKNAKEYHDTKTERRLRQINEALDQLESQRLVAPNLTSLSKIVAEKTGIGYSTLRTNTRYKDILQRYLTSQSQVGLVLNDKTREIETLRSQITSLRLQLSNSEADNKRLQAAYHKASEGTLLEDNSPDIQKLSSDQDLRIKYECTAKVLRAVLERANGFEVNVERRQILDRAARPSEQEFVGSNIVAPFIEWLEKEGFNND